MNVIRLTRVLILLMAVSDNCQLIAMRDDKRDVPAAAEICCICRELIYVDDTSVIRGSQIFEGCSDAHRFHGKCIAVYLRTSGVRCPLCRAPLYAKIEDSQEVIAEPARPGMHESASALGAAAQEAEMQGVASSLSSALRSPSTHGPIRGVDEPIPAHITDIDQILPRYSRIAKKFDLACCGIEMIDGFVFEQIATQLPDLKILLLQGKKYQCV